MKLKSILYTALLLVPGLAQAEPLASVKTSGLLIPDRLEVHVFDDPSIKGIACYITQPKRSLAIEDPSDSAIACRQIGPIAGQLVNANDIYSVNKNWLIKEMRVDRFWDNKRHVLVYLSYSRKMSGDNHAHSISVVPLFNSIK